MQDVHREVKQGEGDTPSCMGSSGRRQIKGFRKSMKLATFTRPLPARAYVSSKDFWEMVSDQSNKHILYVFWT